MLGTFFTLQRYQVKSFNMYCINHNSFWFFSKKEKRKKASQSKEKMGKLSCQCWIVLISFLSQVLLMERKWWNKVVKALHLQSTPQALRSTPPKKLPHWASFTTLQSRSGPPPKAQVGGEPLWAAIQELRLDEKEAAFCSSFARWRNFPVCSDAHTGCGSKQDGPHWTETVGREWGMCVPRRRTSHPLVLTSLTSTLPLEKRSPWPTASAW